MDIIVNLQALNGATLGAVAVNSEVRLEEFRSAVASELELPAWHMQFVLGTVQLNDEQPFKALVETSVPSAAFDLTVIFESDRIISELDLEDELYRCCADRSQLEVQIRELNLLLAKIGETRRHEQCILQEIAGLEFYMQTTSMGLSEEKATVKKIEDLKKKLRSQPKRDAERNEQNRLDLKLHKLYSRLDEPRQRSSEIISKLQASQQWQSDSDSNSRALARLWLRRSTGCIPGFDIFTMPDIKLRPDVCREILYSFSPQGPHLWCPEECSCSDWPWNEEDEDAESDADSKEDYVPEALVHFKLSKARRKLKGWGLPSL